MSVTKRFYKLAVATPEHGVALDGRVVKTPRKVPLILPNAALAEAIAEEWQGQGETIRPSTMFLTKLANTAIDRVHPDRPRLIAEMVDFAGSDLVSYRADRPPELVAQQNRHWNPVVDWALKAMAAKIMVTVGVMHRPQALDALKAVETYLATLDSFSLTAIHNMMTLSGSALLAAMAGAAAIAPEDAWTAAHVDEDYQIEQWGQDEEAAKKRTSRKREFICCLRFMDLLAMRPAGT